MTMRKDALVAAAKMVQVTQKIARDNEYADAVATVGKLVVYPGGVNVIPGRVEFTLEVRDIETSVMDALAKAILSAYQTAAVDAGVTLSYQQTSDVLPAPMDPSMQRVISSVADDLGYVWRTMPSGAGHDAQHLARLCPTGMIFVPSIGGISHAPAEFTPDEDCVRGANVLLNTLARLAGPVG